MSAMTNSRLSSYICVLALLSPSCTSPIRAEVNARGSNNEVSIKADQLNAAAAALKRFKLKQPKWSCFEVTLSKEGDLNRIDFSPMENVIDAGHELIVGASKCGQGISYLVDDSGKIEETILSK